MAVAAVALPGVLTRIDARTVAVATAPAARRFLMDAFHRMTSTPTRPELRPGHPEDVQGFIELLLGDLAAADVAALDDHLPDGPAGRQRLLGDGRGLVVPEVTIQRSHNGR